MAPQAVVPVNAAGPTFPFQASAVLVPPSLSSGYVITSLTIGPDGQPWFTEAHPTSCNAEVPNDPNCKYDGHLKGKVGRLNPDGSFTEYQLPSLFSAPTGIVSAADGNLWFIDWWNDGGFNAAPTIDRITPSGQLDEFPFAIPPPNHAEGLDPPQELTSGSDGNLYFLANYVGNLATNGLLGRVTLQGAGSYVELQKFNFVYPSFFRKPASIVSVGGVLWFAAVQYDNCLTCYPVHSATSLNYFVPSSGFFGGYTLPPDIGLGTIAAGPGDGSVWFTAASASVSSGVALVDRSGRIALHQTGPFGGVGMFAGSDKRVYSSGCGGVCRVDQAFQTAGAAPATGRVFVPEAVDVAGSLWGVVSASASSPVAGSGIQSLKNLDGAGPLAPPPGPVSAAFTATQLPDATGSTNVMVDLNACASTGDFGGFNWTVGSSALVSSSFCDFHALIPVGDVAVTLDAAGVPGGPALSSVTKTVHSVPHAAFTHVVDKTQTGTPKIRMNLNACYSSGAASYQFSVLDQTFGISLTPTGSPASCSGWFVDVLPNHWYSITLTVTGPPSTNGAQDVTSQTVIEQIQPAIKFALDQVPHDVKTTTLHVNSCDSIGAAAYEWTVSGPSGTVVARSSSDPNCRRDIGNLPLHVIASDGSSPFAYYTLVLAATNDIAYATATNRFSMAAALQPPPTFQGCQWISLASDSCLGILGGDILSSFGAKRPPDFLALNVGVGLVSGGLIFACDGSTYVTAGLNTPSFKKIEKIKEAIGIATSGLSGNSFAYGWVGNPQDAAPTNAEIDDFVGPGPTGYQIGAALPGYGAYFLKGEVFGQPQFGLLEVRGLVPDLSVGAGTAVNLAGPLVPGSTCASGALDTLHRALQSGTLPQLAPLGSVQPLVNVSTATAPLNVAPLQIVGVTGSGFTPATQFGASIHSQQVTLGIGTTDASGNVSFSFTVPAGLSPGLHQLVVTGWSQGQPRELSATLNVTSRTLTGTATAVIAAEGTSFSGQAAGFTDTSTADVAADFTASIDWGDGSTSASTVSGPTGGPFAVNGTHTYAEEGSLIVTTTLTHTSSGMKATAQGMATVADPPVNGVRGYKLSSLEGSDSGPQRVATFSDPAGAEPNLADPSGTHYTATIQWSDGASSAGVITGPDAGGVFTVSGSHTYVEEGTYQVTVTIHHEGAADAIATGSAVVMPRNGEILFSRASTADDADHHAQIWIMNPDGSLAHSLTSGNFDDTQPVWSPDGTRIAFTSTRNWFTHIFVMNADGTGLIALTSGFAFDLDPTWSPDGLRIAFTSTRGGRTHIYVVSSSGGVSTALTSGSFYEATPAWSPDGLHVAFTSTQAGYSHIFQMNPNGTGVVALTSGTFYDATPAWSPDGSHIAFTSSRSGSTHIYVMQSNGSGVTALTSGAGFDASPAWAPDASQIAFASTRNGQLHIFVMNADGSGVSAFTSGESIDAFPSWRAAE